MSTSENKCTLLSSCVKHNVPAYPLVTHSGNRDCLETQSHSLVFSSRRVRCAPSCGPQRPYCHGRCVFGGMGCFFHPCSKYPYRSFGAKTCSQLALEISKMECNNRCRPSKLRKEKGINLCQDCLVKNLPDMCGDLTASSCWYCVRPILIDLMMCQLIHGNNPLNVLNCIRDDLTSMRCESCTCNLICYFMDPLGQLCRTCLENPDAASLSIHHQRCPQGYTFDRHAMKCFKTFTNKLTWLEAEEACGNERGHLAQPLSHENLQPIIESINLQGIYEECWIGGKRIEESNNFTWVQDNSTVELDNWADRFPGNVSGSASCMHQTGSDGYWRNWDCNLRTCLSVRNFFSLLFNHLTIQNIMTITITR